MKNEAIKPVLDVKSKIKDAIDKVDAYFAICRKIEMIEQFEKVRDGLEKQKDVEFELMRTPFHQFICCMYKDDYDGIDWLFENMIKPYLCRAKKRLKGKKHGK